MLKSHTEFNKESIKCQINIKWSESNNYGLEYFKITMTSHLVSYDIGNDTCPIQCSLSVIKKIKINSRMSDVIF